MTDPRIEDSLRELDRARRPSEAEQARIRRGVHDRMVGRARRRRRLPLLAVAASAVLVAAVVLWPRGPEPIARALSSEQGSQLRLGDHVTLVYEGRGQASGSDGDITIHWEWGTLHTDVTPTQGVALRVQTDEGSARVVGTVFDVTRDAIGTEVAVLEGTVELTCQGSSPLLLEVGTRHRCYRSAEAALQEARRAPGPAEALAIIERGAQLPGAPAAHRELELRRIDALRATGRGDEALELARSYLDAGHQHRRAELLSVASELAFVMGGCAEAAPLLEALAATPSPPPAAVAQWEACR